MYNKAKSIVFAALALGAVAAVFAWYNAVELAAHAQLVLSLAFGIGTFLLFDNVLLRNVDTRREIIENKNVAYALFLLVPVLVFIGAALSI